MNKAFRPFLIGLVVIALIYSGTWHYFSRQFEGYVEQQLALVQQKGFGVSFESLKIGGFPFGYNLKVKNLEVRRGDFLKTWVDGDVTLSAKLWSPKEISSVVGGSHHLVFDGVKVDGNGFRLKTFTLDRLRFNFAYNDLIVHMNEQELFKAKGLEYDIDFTPDNKENSAELGIRLKELQVAILNDKSLEDNIQNVELALSLQGDLKGNSSLERLTSWFESDGTLDIKKFSLQWGQVNVNAEGTLSIDENFQPVGAFTASIEGSDKAIDILVEKGALDKKIADAVKFAINIFVGDSTKISFSIQDQRLLLGSIPVYKVPRIEWK